MISIWFRPNLFGNNMQLISTGGNGITVVYQKSGRIDVTARTTTQLYKLSNHKDSFLQLEPRGGGGWRGYCVGGYGRGCRRGCGRCCGIGCGRGCERGCERGCGRGCGRCCGRGCGRGCGRSCRRSCGRGCERGCKRHTYNNLLFILYNKSKPKISTHTYPQNYKKPTKNLQNSHKFHTHTEFL